MGIEYKIIKIPEGVISQIHNDLENNGVKIYAMQDVPSVFIDKNIIHPDVAKKSTCVIAALSGSQGEGRNYMFLAAARIDTVSGKYVTDLDPIAMISDLSTYSPSPSAVVKFHGDFQGRTELVTSDISIPVSTLQGMVTGALLSFENAPSRFTEAMHYMAKQYKQKIDGKAEI
jgi:hypothetical protein